MSDKLPKVSIAVVGVVIAQIGGFIWWTAQQASTIANLEETVNVLTVENNATDKTNLIRDVEQNAANIAEFAEILVSMQEEGEETASEVYDEIELIWEDMDGFTEQFIQIIKLQARIAVLEKTVEFSRKDGM
jgi:uncharacterized protein HemX